MGRDEARGLDALEMVPVGAGTTISDWLSTAGVVVGLAREAGILVATVVITRVLLLVAT